LKIAVVGAGLVGVMTAYELAARQHEVTVFESRGSVATQGSFAQSGLLADLSPLPWGIPGLGRRVAPWMGPWAALRHLPWFWRHQRAGRSAVQADRAPHVFALAQASRTRLGELTHQLNLAYEQQSGGLVVLSRPAQVLAVTRAIAAQVPGSQGLELLDAEAARALEPGLAARWPLRAAVKLPSAMVGNGRQLAHLLKTQAQQRGAVYRFDTEVAAVRPGTPASVVLRSGESQSFDAIVVCAGLGSRALLATAGFRLPLLAPWGHAVTAPLSHIEGLGDSPSAPRAAVIDAVTGIVISRIGQRVRVAGAEEPASHNQAPSPAALRRLHAALEAAFPGCAVTRDAHHWKGPRPQWPDGLPRFGASTAPGLWLNLGHGAHGWALACGAAHALAQQMAQEPVGFETRAFAPPPAI
jgi:D-amino-acid dehydrogenase